ncbi:MAG: hypothetical protein D6741_16605 [Planctomycetota bacterium]|nr:MAG: hypothetical protein D6741_16605 [Planctomycetota bacterium]
MISSRLAEQRPPSVAGVSPAQNTPVAGSQTHFDDARTETSPAATTANEAEPSSAAPQEVVIGFEDLLGATVGERIRNLLAVVGCLTILSYVFRVLGGADTPKRARRRR